MTSHDDRSYVVDGATAVVGGVVMATVVTATTAVVACTGCVVVDIGGSVGRTATDSGPDVAASN